MIIRPARPEDAESGGACHVAVWREGYTGLVDPERLAAATADGKARVAGWRTWIAEGRPIIVAVEDDVVLEANPRAQGFYARNRYLPDGVTKMDELLAAPVIRMVRDSIPSRGAE